MAGYHCLMPSAFFHCGTNFTMMPQFVLDLFLIGFLMKKYSQKFRQNLVGKSDEREQDSN